MPRSRSLLAPRYHSVVHSGRMRLRSMLVLTWLVFAGLATTAGFAAVGLVGDGLDVAVAPSAGPTVTATSSPSTTTSASATESPRPSATQSGNATSTAQPVE